MRRRYPGTWLALNPCALALLTVLPGSAAGANVWSLASPDRRCEISLSLSENGALGYTVRRERKPVVLQSPLGVVRDDQAFDRGLVLEQAGKIERRREVYQLFAGIRPRVDNVLNQQSFLFRNPSGAQIAIDLVAGTEGVAFRYRFPGNDPRLRVVKAELTGFAVPPAASAWLQPYHVAGPYTPAYEDFYFKVTPGDPPPESRAKPAGWSFPALFQISEPDSWALLTESGTDGTYCGCHLQPNAAGGVYRVAFAMPNEATKGQTNSAGPEPRGALPWSLPWRLIIMGTASDLATSTLVTDLAPPSQIQDTSWIIPGRASWAWWAFPDGPTTAALFNEFTDFGASMGWEYTLFDAGWWKLGLAGIANYAREKGVAPLAWLSAGDFYDPARRQKKLAEMTAARIRGVKVDFWCSDRQEAIAAIHELFKEAASRQMLVNLHGCTLPRGWQRTWPNFLAAEAVLGTESYMFEPNYTEKAAELNTILPFTRNVAGPMDATPVGCSPKKYSRKTTAAHELATALIFTSGLIHYADSPKFFTSLPEEAVQVLRDAPARWEETRCLVGRPGCEVVFARRSRESWFIAGINGTTNSVHVSLDMSGYKEHRRGTLIAEGADPAMQVRTVRVPYSKNWEHELSPRGGFILRLQK